MPAASRVARFTQANIARAVKGAKKAKLAIASVRIERDGAIVIVPAEPQAPPAVNEWDEP